MTQTVSAVVPACVDAAHELLARLWEETPGVPDDERSRFATALGEIVANVVEHGRTASGEPVHVTLCLSAGDELIEGRVDDDALPAEDGDSSMDDVLAEHGRGLALARAAVDELAHERGPDGNRWRILLRRA